MDRQMDGRMDAAERNNVTPGLNTFLSPATATDAAASAAAATAAAARAAEARGSAAAETSPWRPFSEKRKNQSKSQ